ncbi:MAG: homoserine kinase [Oscillospiraceae bacterium]|nr:homoserine kinase [Oscillospiraceae bacterium]
MKIQVMVPASSANIGSGIDCFGLALPLFLSVTAEPSDKLEIVFSRGFEGEISLENNLFMRAAERIFAKAGLKTPPMKIEMQTDIPQSRGLASSASALVAGAYCANAWLDSPFSQNELIAEVAALEGHPDNVVPCAAGGFTVAADIKGEICYKKLCPEGLRVALAVPDFELSTKIAREALPKNVSLKLACAQLQRASLLVASIADGDMDMLRAASEDLIFTPARRCLIPGFDEAASAALEKGAYCSMISGAGPTVMALCSENTALDASEAMAAAFGLKGIKAASYALQIDFEGARLTIQP